MTDDIVARLRDLKPETPILTILSRLMEAADSLEAAEARVRELEAEVEALTNNGEVLARAINDMRAAGLALKARVSTIEAETIERCAKMAKGDIYKERYCTWPWWGSGNRSEDSEITKFADALAAAIRQFAKEDRHAKAE